MLNTDSYKQSHWKLFPPDALYLNAYIEARKGEKTVFFGLQSIIKKYLTGQVVTKEKIDEAEYLINSHIAPGVFNRKGWEYILNKHEGKLPIEIKAVQEGNLVNCSNVLVDVVNTDPEVPWLPGFLETLLLQVWYPCTVGTKSHDIKQLFLKYLNQTGDPSSIDFKCHDFGFRGCSSVESAGIAGLAHLVSFKGTDTLSALTEGKNYYNEPCAGFSIPACYDEDTEILTSNGFVPFLELKSNHKVAQYYMDGTVDFILPTAIYNYPYTGNMISYKNSYSDLCVTPNHRLIRRSLATGDIEIILANMGGYSHRNSMIQSAKLKKDGKGITFLDRLRIAFQADGSFPSRKHKYNGKNSGCLPIRFGLKKPRKIERLRWVLQEINTEYFESTDKRVGGDYTHFWIKIKDNEEFLKDFSWVDLSEVTYTWAREFIDEITHWDGSSRLEKYYSYSSINKFNADMVQAIAAIAGYRARVSPYQDSRNNRKVLYEVQIFETEGCGGQGIVRSEIENFNGFVYCVSVPSGMLIVRRNGKVCISGNSEHSTVCSWRKENETKAYRNAFKAYPTGLLAIVCDSYNIYHTISNIFGEVLKDLVLNRDGVTIFRPDSSTPHVIVLEVLDMLGEKFGFTVNNKGYKVLNPKVRVIQGDGINYFSIARILSEMKDKGWSADNLTVGSGSKLLQEHTRDDFGFAMKCSYGINSSGECFEVFKDPITDPGKKSKKGRLGLIKKDGKYCTTSSLGVPENTELKTVFLNGKLMIDLSLEDVRQKLKKEVY
jgi:nicotinic acid phosphoribosyltransferase